MSILYRGRFRGEDLFGNQPIRNKNCLWWPCLLTDRYKMCNFYRGPSIDASYQVRFIWQCGFRGEYFFRNQPIRNKNCIMRECLLKDRDEMSYLNRAPSIDASYQISVQFAMRFQRRNFMIGWFLQNLLFWNCLSKLNRNLIGSIYGRSSIKVCSFSCDPLSNMAATGNFYLWLIDF